MQPASVSYKSPLHQMTQTTPTCLWNDSAAIEELTDDYLAETNVDWYNNDGGFGELIIDVDEGTVALEVSVRFTESSTEYSCTRDIVTGEELED